MSDAYDVPWPPERKVKVAHLVTGLVFLGLAGTWALRADGTLGDLEIAVLVPVVLVVAGAVGLLTLLVGNHRARARRRHHVEDTWIDDSHTYDTDSIEETQPINKEQ